MKPLCIVGAGFSGAVLARELVTHSASHVCVMDSRSHVGGNCHTERCAETGVMVHRYGPHIFNTNDVAVWKWLSNWTTMMPFVNRVKAATASGVYSLPINLHTINQFFHCRLNPREARDFVGRLAVKSDRPPANFEELALSKIGTALYQEFIYGYTKKQWGCEPSSLPASVFNRLPVRFDYNDNYYDTLFQGIPSDGYSAIIQRLLDHPRISLQLGTSFKRTFRTSFDAVFYTGGIDSYFDFCHGRLGYRTVTWKKIVDVGDMQGTAVINYPDLKDDFTRIHEHKHFAPWERHDKSIALIEFSRETRPDDVPFYPKRLPDDLRLLERYRELAETETGTTFLGRLGTYRYLNMDQVIAEALSVAQSFLQGRQSDLINASSARALDH